MTNPNPIFDLGNPTWVLTVAVAETPPETAVYAGRYLSVAEGVQMPPLGTRGIVQVSGVQVPGYLRNVNGEYQWVIMPLVDPVDAAVSALPGPQGWTDQGAQATWLGIAIALRGYGVSNGDLGPGLAALYNAARVNLLAEYGVS